MALRFVIMTVLPLLIFSMPAYARIGETQEQCKQRYGIPVKVDSVQNMMGFKKSGFFIIIQFHDGKADMIRFSKLEQNILGIATEMSENEIETLLKANGSKVWKQREVISMNREYETEDGVLFAQYDIMENTLMILTNGYIARHEAKNKAKEDDKLKEF